MKAFFKAPAAALFFYLLPIILTLSIFQNCSRMKFSEIQDMTLSSSRDSSTASICKENDKPQDTLLLNCPNTTFEGVLQSFTVICQADGTWQRTEIKPADYSRCAGVCTISKPNTPAALVPCLHFPYENQGVQNYDALCKENGTWETVKSGAIDYSFCQRSCDPNAIKPDASDLLLRCPNNVNSMAGVQRRQVICSNTFEWKLENKGAADYSRCVPDFDCGAIRPETEKPRSCNPGYTGQFLDLYKVECDRTTGQYTSTFMQTLNQCVVNTPQCGPRPSETTENVACPAPFTTYFLAKRDLEFNCINGQWISSPTTRVDTSLCPVNLCNEATKPSTEKDVRACPGGASGRVYLKDCQVQCQQTTWSQANCSAENFDRCTCAVNETFNPTLGRCVPIVIPGECGSSANQNFDIAPTTNLCRTGNASTMIIGANTFTWSCSSVNTGNVTCVAQKNIYAGQCGAAHRSEPNRNAPTTNLCNVGQPSGILAPALGNSNWQWSCSDSNGQFSTSRADCSMPATIDGQCGPINNTVLSSKPEPSHDCATCTCTRGTPSMVHGNGPWTWTCGGLNYGANAECSALPPQPQAGVCGSLNNKSLTPDQMSVSSIMTGGLCAVGSTSVTSGGFISSGRTFEWGCQGQNNGSTVNCSATNSAVPDCTQLAESYWSVYPRVCYVDVELGEGKTNDTKVAHAFGTMLEEFHEGYATYVCRDGFWQIDRTKPYSCAACPVPTDRNSCTGRR